MQIVQNPIHKLMCVLVLVRVKHGVRLLDGMNKPLVVECASLLFGLTNTPEQVVDFG